MMDNLNISWKMVGCAAAVFLIISGVIGRFRRQPTSSERVTVHASFTGRIGRGLATHALISVITGAVGWHVILALAGIPLAILLSLIGWRVEVPEKIKEWPRAVMTRVKETLYDKKDDIAERFHEKKEGFKEQLRDAKDAVVSKVAGRSLDSEFPEDVPVDSDEFWGGHPKPDLNLEERLADARIFDSLPPDQKIAIFETAKPMEAALPPDLPDIYASQDWYKVRIGRSAHVYTTMSRLVMYKTMWMADREFTHHMDAKVRAHITRLTPPPNGRPYETCAANFQKLPAAERYAAFNSAWKLTCPLPKTLTLKDESLRAKQLYSVRICSCAKAMYLEDQLKEAKEAAFEDMLAAEIADAEGRGSRLLRSAKENVGETASRLGSKTKASAGNLKDRLEDSANKAMRKAIWGR